jgi:molybdenum transport protein
MSPYVLSDTELDALLQDDAPCGDATSFALGVHAQPGRMVFRARYDMRVCGSEEAQRMGAMRGLVTSGAAKQSGSVLHAGDEILSLEGEAAALHRVWKTAQTLMEYMSGIATATGDILAAGRRGNPAVSVVCTRKHFPGTKTAAVKAVLCAGASPHRLSLSETLLVFAEHRAFLTGDTPVTMVERLRAVWPERPVIAEVSSEAEAMNWVEAGVDILQLEKLSPDTLANIRRQIPAAARVRIAAAGGVNADNAEAYAGAGADILVTSAPYFAKAKDVAVTLRPR